MKAMRDDGASFGRIADQLNAEGADQVGRDMGQHDGQENPRPRCVKQMNKQVDLISSDKAIGIAEDRGWKDLDPIHQRLTDLARGSRLRTWGYKGSSAELRLIDPLVWQDHGLDMLNGHLVVPGKFLSPDYAEQTWRDVHWDRQEIEAAFPDPDESGEERCSGWLMQEMRENPENPPKPKQAYAKEAAQRCAVSRKAFDRIWAVAIKEAGAKWNRPGPRRRTPDENS